MMSPCRFLPTLAAFAGVLVSSFAAAQRGNATTQPSTALPDETRLEIFLLVGQSNMSGRGKVEERDRVADPRIWTLDKAGAWVPAVDPLHFDKPKVAGVGLGRTFAQTIVTRDPNVTIGLVPCAVGGTSINEWARGGTLYNEAVRRARLAQTHGELRGILWHQGEADTAPAKLAAYPQKLATLLAALREDLKVPGVPVVVGHLGAFDENKGPRRQAFNAMLSEFAATQPNVACATSERLTDVGDGTHFDAEAQREFGRRYAAAFFTLIDAAATRPASR